MIPYNPFTNRSTINSESGFVGREEQIGHLLSLVRNGGSASIVGPRRIGKSSLLYHLFLTGNRRLDDPGKLRFQFIYLNLQDPRCATITGFCQRVMQELGPPLGEAERQMNELEHLSRLAEVLQVHAEKPLPVLLMDEFEKLVEKPDRFTDDFFNALRAFGDQHQAAIITVSQRTLRALTASQGLTSPLWNIFSVQRLGEFEVSDVVDEVTLFLTHFWRGVLQPTDEEQTYLISYCSRHPLVMQVVSYWILRNRESRLNELALLREIDQDLSSYFRTDRERISRWLRQQAPTALENLTWSSEQIGRMVKSLSPFSLRLDK